LIDQYWDRRIEMNWRVVDIANVTAVIHLTGHTRDSKDTCADGDHVISRGYLGSSLGRDEWIAFSAVIPAATNNNEQNKRRNRDGVNVCERGITAQTTRNKRD
jgi:hypothetical protein